MENKKERKVIESELKSTDSDLSLPTKAQRAHSDEDPIFEKEKYARMTLRLTPELADALERFVSSKTQKQRQKKKVIVVALENFLREAGFY